MPGFRRCRSRGVARLSTRAAKRMSTAPSMIRPGVTEKGAAADGLLEVFPSEPSKSQLLTTLGRFTQAEVAGLLQDLFDLSLILLRHVVTLGSKGRIGCGPRSDCLLPRSTVRCALPIVESYLLRIFGVKGSALSASRLIRRGGRRERKAALTWYGAGRIVAQSSRLGPPGRNSL